MQQITVRTTHGISVCFLGTWRFVCKKGSELYTCFFTHGFFLKRKNLWRASSALSDPPNCRWINSASWSLAMAGGASIIYKPVSLWWRSDSRQMGPHSRSLHRHVSVNFHLALRLQNEKKYFSQAIHHCPFIDTK